MTDRMMFEVRVKFKDVFNARARALRSASYVVLADSADAAEARVRAEYRDEERVTVTQVLPRGTLVKVR